LPKVHSKIAGRLATIGSVLLAAFTAACYELRNDQVAAVTVFPHWSWAIVGIGLAAFGARILRKRWLAWVAVVWLVFLVAFADHPTSFFRRDRRPDAKWSEARREGRAVRVVSLNCAGSTAAAAEVAAVEPDIVLLQESPPRAQLESLARELFGDDGHVLRGVDAAIVARGSIERRDLPRSAASHAVGARLHLAGSREVEVVSLRLEHGLVRFDLWAPDCWREQTANRRRRREQLATVLRGLDDVAADVPLIVGGDFNAPPGDAVYRLLTPRLRDSFAVGGRGWGNTIVNEYPFLRIDQVWVSDRFRAVDVFSSRTRHSDHRMVVCDVVLE
jgi:endonuclease/exonuclease/phosphatase (EEP) superfamily protein YafD